VAEKTKPHAASPAHGELETGLERFIRWISENSMSVLAAVGILLAGVGAFEFARSRAETRATEASNALDETQSAYLTAMGAEPGAVDVPELANPEAGKRIREEYVEKFRAVAQAHPGTLPAALAWLEVADLQTATPGSEDAILESLRASLAEQPNNPRLAGLVRQRIAQVYEDRGQLAEAAAEHEAAGALPEFPLRWYALADAARCYAQAGDRTRALALLDRIESEAQDAYTLPMPLRGLQRELRAAANP
jgi:predicted negative regulator of RcsB-dependent stress response